MLSSMEYKKLNQIIDLVPMRAEDMHAGGGNVLNELLARRIVKKQNIKDKHICNDTLLTVDFEKANKALDDYREYLNNPFLYWMKQKFIFLKTRWQNVRN